MKNAPFVRNMYNYDTNKAGDESGLQCKDKTLTQQHFKDECDINKLVERYVITGEIPQLSLPPMAGDFTNVPDMQAALDLVVAARNSFNQLPAAARARFGHNPVEFVEFCSDEANRDEMRKMGLWSPEAAASFASAEKEAQDLIQEGKAARAAKTAPTGETGDTTKGVT